VFLRDLPRRILVALLVAYKLTVSRILPPACRFHPTCSEYAAEAVARHGVLRGGRLAGARLLRCHPFHSGGLDPVPVSPGSDPERSRGRAAPRFPVFSEPGPAGSSGKAS
jgi:hypothetical protein